MSQSAHDTKSILGSLNNADHVLGKLSPVIGPVPEFTAKAVTLILAERAAAKSKAGFPLSVEDAEASMASLSAHAQDTPVAVACAAHGELYWYTASLADGLLDALLTGEHLLYGEARHNQQLAQLVAAIPEVHSDDAPAHFDDSFERIQWSHGWNTLRRDLRARYLPVACVLNGSLYWYLSAPCDTVSAVFQIGDHLLYPASHDQSALSRDDVRALVARMHIEPPAFGELSEQMAWTSGRTALTAWLTVAPPEQAQ